VTEGDQVRQVIGRLHDAWSKHPPDEISQAMDGLWHRDAVILAGAQEMARGRDACIKSYRDFVEQVTLEDTTLGQASIEVWGDTAVATSSWHMTYDLDGQRHSESGHESFVLVRTEREWEIVWRSIIPTARA
jgi:ketosteroid isomerase-like protein